MSDYYSILGVGRAATTEEIKKQYKKLAIKFHPDKNKEKGAHEKFLLISEAYETLKDDELRQEYNIKNSISRARTSPYYQQAQQQQQPEFGGHFLSRFRSDQAFGLGGGAGPGNFKFGNSFRSGSSYFSSYFESNSRAYADYFQRPSKSREKREDPQKVAEDAKKMMQEHLERKKAEYLRNAKMRADAEEEHRRKMEQVLRDYTQPSTNSQRRTRNGKSEKFQNLWDLNTDSGTTNTHFASVQPGQNSSRPIVVDDDTEEESPGKGNSEASDTKGLFGVDVEEGLDVDVDGNVDVDEELGSESEDDLYQDADSHQNTRETGVSDLGDSLDSEGSNDSEAAHSNNIEEDENEFFHHDKATNPPSEGLNHIEETSFASEADEYPKTPVSEPDVVEINDTDETGEVREGVPHDTTHSSAKRTKHTRQTSFALAPNGAKKPRLSNYDDMKSSLGTDLNDLDFSDILDNLPGTSKASTNSVPSPSRTSKMRPSKRPKLAEFTDGLTRALTLFTPVNRFNLRDPSHTVTVRDLQPKIDLQSLKFLHSPPQLHLQPSTSKEEWEGYSAKMQLYQQKFSAYRKLVLEYQVARFEIDEKCHNIIYSDADSLAVYQQCLTTEYQVMREYDEAFLEFQQATRIFRANCMIMKSNQ